ncbi:ileal sodium/bile acid cotransporter-like [Ptychodera flava]|uniref:ileal sodium/bile acid cotransporter-like n=1 Tax=Ptychodera flava TaxID=63121 RepID=UPI003969CFE1
MNATNTASNMSLLTLRPAFTSWPTVSENFNQSGIFLNSTDAPRMDSMAMTLAKVHEVSMTVALIFIILGMGATITMKDLWSNIRRPYGIIIGAVSQFLVMPLCGFAMAHATNMSPSYAIGTLIVCCCPGGTLSNIFTYWADGDVALSICMTSISTLLAIGMMPLCLFIYSRSWTDPGGAVIPYVNIIISLVSVVVPAAIGCLCKYKLPKVAKYVIKVSSIIGGLGILSSLVMVILRRTMRFDMSWKVWLAASTLPMGGFCFGYILSSIFRLDATKRRTVALETGLQNVILALSLITLSYPNSEEQIEMLMVPTLFGPFMTTEAIAFVVVYRCVTRCRRKSTTTEKGNAFATENQDLAEDVLTVMPQNGNEEVVSISISYPLADEAKHRDVAMTTDETFTNFAFQ